MRLTPAGRSSPVISIEARTSYLRAASARRNPSSLSFLRLTGFLLLLALLTASSARAEYIVLRGGERLHVTGYQLVGDKYHLQLQGGWMDVPASDVVAIEPEEVFTPVAAQPAPTAPDPFFHDLVAAAATRYGVDADLITSVIAVESHFDPKAISRKNARGLMQLLPETAARFGVKDIFNPQENIEAGTRYLKELLQLYNNDLALTLAAYNAGPDNVQKYGAIPPFAETISYVRRVKLTYAKSKSAVPISLKAPGSAKTSSPLTALPPGTPAPNPALTGTPKASAADPAAPTASAPPPSPPQAQDQ